jgi:hypothetical protein
MRERPLSASLGVREGRDAYLAENGFTVEEYDAKVTKASFLGVEFSVPNTKKHREAIMLHDLHHVATGYGTDIVGEGEISAWELRRGLRGLGLYVGSIVIAGTLAGLALAPRRTIAAWRASDARGSLFQTPRPYADLLAMSVGDLRRELRVPDAGVARKERRLHSRAPRSLAAA